MSTVIQGLPTIAVAVKSVPVGGAFLRIVNGGLARAGLAHGLDPINEVAVEWAIRAHESGQAGRVVGVCMGPDDGGDAIRRTLAMGCDEVLLVSDPALAGADVPTTARVVAAAVNHVGADVAVFGYESLDGSSGTVPAAVAALLDRPLLSFAKAAELHDWVLRIERQTQAAGQKHSEADLPAVVTIVAGSIDPRFPKLKDLLAARKGPVPTCSLAELDVALPPTAAERVTRLVEVPSVAKEARRVAVDDGPREIHRLLDELGLLSG